MVIMPNQVFPLNTLFIPRDRENEEIEVFFRPEHAEVVEATGEGHLKTTVAAAFFMGDHARLLLDWTDSGLSHHRGQGKSALFKGEAIEIGIDPKTLRTLKG